MIKIANGGNISGRDISRENTLGYLESALAAGFDVKIDAWLVNDVWMLGASFPNSAEKIPLDFMQNPRVWVRAMNLIGYVSLYNNSKVHVFWHNKDDFAFTSKAIKWAAPGIITQDGVMNMVENFPLLVHKIQNRRINPLGICCDDFEFLNISESV